MEVSTVPTVGDAFPIFPEEIWEMILEVVDDYRDVFNVLSAYPGMNQAFQKKKKMWLFKQVIPILWEGRSQLGHQELLICRLVCKKWRGDIDSYLECEPGLQPYDPVEHGRGPDSDFCIRKELLASIDAEVENHSLYTFYGGVRFDDHVRANQFLQDLESSYKMDLTSESSKAPSVFRTVTIDFQDEDRSDELMRQDWNSLLPVAKRVGRFVRHLELSYYLRTEEDHDGDVDVVDFENLVETRNWQWEQIVKILSELPELKSFRLVGPHHPLNLDFDFEIPSLPQLETLELGHSGLRRGIAGPFVSQYAAQLRRLQVGIEFWWKQTDPQKNKDNYEAPYHFPNLTELELTKIYGNELIFRKLLIKLKAPQLVRLATEDTATAYLNELGEGDYRNHLQTFSSLKIGRDLFLWLRRHPLLQSLYVASNYFRITEEPSGWDPEVVSFPNLTILRIRDGLELTYDFLLCLPNLQYLILKVDVFPKVTDNSVKAKGKIKIREQIQTRRMYESNIWELLPKLRMVALFADVVGAVDLESYEEFDRWTYEQLKRNGMNGDGEPEVKLYPLREDIWLFLGRNAEGHMLDEEGTPY